MSQYSSKGAEYERNRLIVLDRDGWTCNYCYKPLEGDDATADHIISKQKWIDQNLPGNPDDIRNLVAACRSCNGSKSNRDEMPRTPYYNPRWFTT